MLACVILLRVNRKARTKPICLWGVNPSRHFQCLALGLLSYINVVAGSVGDVFGVVVARV